MFKDIIKLMSGNIGAQILVFVSLPLVTRLFAPSIFGEYSALLAVAMFLAVFATLKFELAIIVLKRATGKSLFKVGLFWVSLFCLAYLLILEIIRFFGFTETHGIQYSLLFFVMTSYSYYFLVASVYNKNARYGPIAISKVLQAFFMVLTQLVFGYVWGTVESLLIAYSISFFVATLFLILNNRELFGHYIRSKPTKRAIRASEKFIYFQTPAAAINFLSQNVFTIILLVFYGPVASGLYALSNRLILAPSALVGKSVRDVFMQRSAELLDDRIQLKKLYLVTFRKLFLLALPVFGVAAICAIFLFERIFGAEWQGGGVMFAILCLWGIWLFSNSPATATINTLGLQKFSLVFEIVSLGLRCLSVLVAFWLGASYEQATLVFSIVSSLVNIFYIWFVYDKI